MVELPLLGNLETLRKRLTLVSKGLVQGEFLQLLVVEDI